MVPQTISAKRSHLALNAFVKLMRASDSITARTHRHLGNYHLTISQFGVLEALLHLGTMPQKDIGDKLLKSSGNITTVINNLAKQKLVVRQKDPSDRRFCRVRLTERGRQLIEAVFPIHAAVITEEMGYLDDRELELLGRLCRKLGLKEEAPARPNAS
jgi:MarR family 2-MHQ and catechol resistance regulon transcriptional repressor